MDYAVWLFAGLAMVAPLLAYANGKGWRANQRIFGRGLLVAAGLYVAFAAIDGNIFWLLVETLGVAVFYVFYCLGTTCSMGWLALGWFLHPVWDGLIHLAGPGAEIAPFWYAVACLSFDWAIALYLSVRLRRVSVRHNQRG